MFIHSNKSENNGKFLGIVEHEKIVLSPFIIMINPIINMRRESIIFHAQRIRS